MEAGNLEEDEERPEEKEHAETDQDHELREPQPRVRNEEKIPVLGWLATLLVHVERLAAILGRPQLTEEASPSRSGDLEPCLTAQTLGSYCSPEKPWAWRWEELVERKWEPVAYELGTVVAPAAWQW